MPDRLYKYPRTHHLHGSRFQPGDDELNDIPREAINGRYVVIEEKCDGANSAISFDQQGRVQLQSRGHFLTGGGREKHFNLLKQWANALADRLWPVLGSRYVMYGEWVYAKHTIFYDSLPHYFLEFDVLDTTRDTFLSTQKRRQLLAGLPIVSVPVLFEGIISAKLALDSLIGLSQYIQPGHLQRLQQLAEQQGLDVERIRRETDPSQLMEGLYLKVEDASATLERYKFIRASFLQAVVEAEGHWLQRPIIPNQLAPGVDLFA